MTRRFFSGLGLSSLLSIPLFNETFKELYKGKNKKKVMIHHVFFWLKNPEKEEETLQLIDGLKALTEIEVLKKYHIGKPAKTEQRSVIDNTYTVSWYTEFANEAEEKIYQKHPIHLDFVKKYEHLFDRVVVYDTVDI